MFRHQLQASYFHSRRLMDRRWHHLSKRGMLGGFVLLIRAGWDVGTLKARNLHCPHRPLGRLLDCATNAHGLVLPSAGGALVGSVVVTVWPGPKICTYRVDDRSGPVICMGFAYITLFPASRESPICPLIVIWLTANRQFTLICKLPALTSHCAPDVGVVSAVGGIRPLEHVKRCA